MFVKASFWQKNRLKRLSNDLVAFVFLLCFSLFANATPQANKPIVFGVYAYVDEASVRAEYQPLLDYLNQQLGEDSVQMKILSMDKFNDAIRDHQVDVITTNATHYLQLRYYYPITGVLATLVRKSEGEPMAQLGGVIFTKSNRDDINRLSDVRNKRIALSNQHHLGGFWAQLYEFHKAGIELKDSQLLAVGTHQQAVLSVLSGQADVGFARTSVIELMQHQGRLLKGDIKVINAQYFPSFTKMISTALYPEWAVFALADTGNERVADFTRALLAYHPLPEQVKDGDILRYSVAADYMKVEALARELRLSPFDQAPRFNWLDAWRKWSTEGVLAIIFGLLLIVSTLLLIVVARQAQAERYRAQLLLSSLGEGVFGLDLEGHCTFINQVALSMLGYREADLLHQDYHQLLHHHYSDGSPFPKEECPVYQTLADGQRRSGETHFICASGRFLPVHYTVTPIKQGADVTVAEVIMQDITEQKESEKRLYHLANFDALTTCLNRRYFMEQLQQQFQIAQKDSGTMALLMLDLDYFKGVNDRYGHAAGDIVLQDFAALVNQSLREGDLVGRMGGEEFAILLPNTDMIAARQWADSLRRQVEKHVSHYQEQAISITVSIGIAPFQISDKHIDHWLSRADSLMYRAKALGRNRVEVS
jgi:diguanylate cyclase (GGDEF)-like protein/PAS domain S-box-containing protein